MKKAIMAIAALAATMAALTAHAATWTDPATGITWTYTVSNGKASLGGGYSSPAVPKTSTGALTIPSTINGYSVTSIGFYAFLWLYADKDPGLTLANGALKNGTTQLASGTSTSNPNAIRYIYSKMGYQLLTGAALNYANSETRLGLSPSGVRQYAYKIVEE